ncbi:hypothetical protein CEE45_06095 [Candidatus Heimdallarchaeota archaeon B3_Heim]|nr:MAG: hypothetical protein CEE45_06095 [Candidatus Heimdallarchaeota archaeon B3_Heim]
MTAQEEEQNPPPISPKNQMLEKIAVRLWDYFVRYRLLLIVGLLAFWLKIVYTSSIDMWDEGWFVSIASRIADGLSDPFLPLYYRGNNETLQLFDKPPFAFIFGALLMNIFGKSTFGANGMNAIGGAGLAVVIYLLFSHQKETKSAHAIAGLLVALASFLNFYSRTAYIDPFVIFMGSIVFLAGIRAIDAIFVDNNLKKGYLLIILTGILNVLNVMTKAWQGVLIAPSIAIYLVFRYLERHVDFSQLKIALYEIRESFSLSFSDNEERSSSSEQTYANLFPYFVFLLASVISFIIAVIYNQLLVAGLIIAIVSASTCFAVFLRFWKNEFVEGNYLVLFFTGLTSVLAAFAGNIIVSLFYNRLEDAFKQFATALSSNDMSIIKGILFFLSEETLENLEALNNEVFILALLELIGALLGSIVTIILALIVFGLLLDFISSDRAFIRFIYELIDSFPLIIMGIWLMFWFVGLLLLGLVFDRNASSITLMGVAISLLLIPLLSYYPHLKNKLIKFYNLKARIRSQTEQSIFSSHILFIGITLIVIILSFYPFIAWIQYIDTNLVNFPWVVRTPGELAGDPNKPDVVTYTFLFFDYYIGWRYTSGTKYNLADSLGGAINDYVLVVMLPFFLIGLWAFFFSERRNPALGSALITWLLVIPLVFFPAMFQLNYYYIPLVLPYLAIAAKGFEFIYSYEKMRLLAVDNVEKGLAGGYFFLEIGFTFVYVPLTAFLGNGNLNSLFRNLFVGAIYLIPFIFLCFHVLKTFPGIITAGFAYKFFIDAWFRGGGGLYRLYDYIVYDFLDMLFELDFSWIGEVMEFGAPLATFVGLILLIVGLYWLKPKIKPQLTIILALAMSGMLVNVSTNVHYNQIFDLRYQEMAIYINNHGGDYNYSTWAINEGGTQFALRYYLEYEVKETGNYPFSSNSTSDVNDYFTNHLPDIHFWVIVNHTGHWWDSEKGTGVPPYAEMYPEAYKWLTTNPDLACVDEIVGLTIWYKMHLFVNKTWITEQGSNWKTLSGK